MENLNKNILRGSFAKVINDSLLESTTLDKSLICIILDQGNSKGHLIPTVQINNDIRQFLCLAPTKAFVRNLSCSCQSIETSNFYYIKFNIKNIRESLRDELIYKLSCNIGLKHKCAWCSYIQNGVLRRIQLHY